MCIHSPELALEYCDRILLMKDGKLFQILMYMQPVFQKSMRKCLLYMIISMLLNVLIPREMYTE